MTQMLKYLEQYPDILIEYWNRLERSRACFGNHLQLACHEVQHYGAKGVHLAVKN